MAKGLKHGAGGGASLNFKVVGGTSAPASPKENTIWVNTSAEITSWVFSVTEPETPAAGMVWISVGTTSPVEFNALKKNSIMVYPLSAKQYVSGAWVDKEAKSYQDGAWVDWLKVVVTKPDKIETYNGATYRINGNSITVKHSGTNGTAAYFGYKADLTDVKTVRVHFTKRNHKAETSFVSKSGVGILSSSQTSGVMQFWNGTFLASTINSVNNAGYVDVSVESLSGELYIWVGCYGISYDSNELAFDSIELVE